MNKGLVHDKSTYSQALRAIGNALRELQAELIDLRCDGENYIVRARSRRQGSKTSSMEDVRHAGFRIRWEILPSGCLSSAPSAAAERVYTPIDVKRMEHAGQARREKDGMPDPHSLATALRILGAYIDDKEGRLMDVSSQEQSITIRYETSRREPCTEEFTPASIQALFAAMYLRRSDQALKNGYVLLGEYRG